jgi:hypothetical protein
MMQIFGLLVAWKGFVIINDLVCWPVMGWFFNLLFGD